MIVPRFWAEASARHRAKDRQITVRRVGWSNTSAEAASRAAEERAQQDLQRILQGDKLPLREPKVPYNGAEGVPIREEIVATHGDTVITRNSYGALCLNTPNILFADVDFAPRSTVPAGCLLTLLLMLGSAVWTLLGSQSSGQFTALALVSMVAGPMLARIGGRTFLAMQGGPARLAARRLEKFARAHPDWRIRHYQTPAGLRALVIHDTFDPASPQAARFFAALGTDPTYVKMCRRQRCFRARVSPKPWRIGIPGHLKPRPGTWPVRPERRPQREAWLRDYDAKSQAFASCRFVAELGQGPIHPAALAVQQVHDHLARADSQLPIA